jgi:multidrug transporter EmrE-like cation transporter
MSTLSFLLLFLSTFAFIAGGSAAKSWALSDNNWGLLVLTLALYSAGNLIMLRLVRDLGMGVALSLSGFVQLLAVNVVAFLIFGESIAPLHAAGLVLGIVAVALMTYPV